MTTKSQPRAAGQAAHTVRVPLVFWSDHEDRDLPTPPPTHRHGAHIVIPLYGAETDELLADAEHYAHRDGPGSIGLKSSARATVKAIKEARGTVLKVTDASSDIAREFSSSVVGLSNKSEVALARIIRGRLGNSHAALVAALESIALNSAHESRLHGVNGATAALSRVASTARAALAQAKEGQP